MEEIRKSLGVSLYGQQLQSTPTVHHTSGTCHTGRAWSDAHLWSCWCTLSLINNYHSSASHQFKNTFSEYCSQSQLSLETLRAFLLTCELQPATSSCQNTLWGHSTGRGSWTNSTRKAQCVPSFQKAPRWIKSPSLDHSPAQTAVSAQPQQQAAGCWEVYVQLTLHQETTNFSTDSSYSTDIRLICVSTHGYRK